MPREDSLIPFEATELTGARILVLGAHPDDESLGAGGTMALNAGKAEAIRVWIATDGTGQEGVEPEGREAYGARRREEAVRAAGILGLDPPRFGGLEDGGLARQPDLVEAAVRAQLEEFAPDLVLCPSPAEIHPDHRALARSVFGLVASSRPADPDHDRYRFLRVAFYELSHPMLPNTLVDIAGGAARKAEALAAYASQQEVRDYAGAMQGLNAYRRLTLPGQGPVEAFRLLTFAEASTISFEELRRAIGPGAILDVDGDGPSGPAPVSVVIRTRNRPALLREALESLRTQTVRPKQVIVVNDGGASPREITDGFREAFDVVLEDSKQRLGRSAAANRGVALAREPLVAFLDDDDRCYPDHVERLVAGHRQGPEPVVYTDAATVVYGQGGGGWEPRVRTLQYSLDYDPDFLLLANYIPVHTVLLPRELYRKVGGFDEGLEYSEDWDFLIRLSAETPFRHLRAVTCEYRVFEPQSGSGDSNPSHVASGAGAFQDARRKIFERYAARRTEAGLARMLDRMRAQIAFWYDRDGVSQGELRYQRESHRRLDAKVVRLETRENDLRLEKARLASEIEQLHARLTESQARNDDYDRLLANANVEVERLNGILQQIYESRTWKLHLFLDRLRGRR
ncbi:MAG TPA: PIG-L family deacetylase [Thermoanaerobaculia bacterium]|jgi:LmbE family N-acetylglucosaminyl deacetylase/glycosyltransferase involved in cell wall biosynthesis